MNSHQFSTDPPSFDTTGWVEREPGDVIPAGTVPRSRTLAMTVSATRLSAPSPLPVCCLVACPDDN